MRWGLGLAPSKVFHTKDQQWACTGTLLFKDEIHIHIHISFTCQNSAFTDWILTGSTWPLKLQAAVIDQCIFVSLISVNNSSE